MFELNNILLVEHEHGKQLSFSPESLENIFYYIDLGSECDIVGIVEVI